MVGEQFDGLAVRGVLVTLDPSFAAHIQTGSIGQSFLYDQALESRQPMVVIARADSGSQEIASSRTHPMSPYQFNRSGPNNTSDRGV
jgi:hypothetical protein